MREPRRDRSKDGQTAKAALPSVSQTIAGWWTGVREMRKVIYLRCCPGRLSWYFVAEIKGGSLFTPCCERYIELLGFKCRHS